VCENSCVCRCMCASYRCGWGGVCSSVCLARVVLREAGVVCCVLCVVCVFYSEHNIFADLINIFAANSDEFGTQNALLTGCVSCESLPQNKMKAPSLNPAGTDGTYGE
jgi:hypothetical protein